MRCFAEFCENASPGASSGDDLTPGLPPLWLHVVGVASAFLGVPDVVLHSTAQWIQVGCSHVVLATLNLIQ